MKTQFRRIISLILCSLILIGAVIPALAKEEKTAFIVVSGMNTFPLYDTEENKVYPLATADIVKLVGDVLPDVGAYLITKDEKKLADRVLPKVKDLFDVIACNPDGSSKYDIHTTKFGSLTEYTDLFSEYTKDEEGIVNAGIQRFGAENTFFFNYDWRLSPLDHADELNEFIKFVKETTECDRVALACFSMGGTVTLSYLSKYGSEDLNSVEFCSTAFQGTSIVGELFKGDLEVSLDGLFKRLGQLTRNNTFEQIIYYLNDGLNKNGFNSSVSGFANGLVDSIKEEIYSGLFIPVFGYMPGLWALAPDEYYEADKAYMLNNGADDALIEKIDTYHEIQTNAKEIISSAMEDTSVYIFAQYGMAGVPASPKGATSNNDYLIDCIYASGGATCSDLNETLGDDYKQQLLTDYNYLSADGQIDASTCLFPETTWFICGMGHVDYPMGEASDFVLWFAEQDEQKTVKDCIYPQFQRYDYGSETLSTVEGAKEGGATEKVLSFFYNIRNFFYNILNSIFNIFNR